MVFVVLSVFFVVLPVDIAWIFDMFLVITLFTAYAGYLQFCGTGQEYPVHNSSGVEQTTMALCVKVLVTLYLAEM